MTIRKKIISQQFERSFAVERSAVSVEDRTVELAFASEAPVERWFGIEILDCSARSVDLARLKSGGAVLVGHNHDDQVGVVDNVRIDADRVCRATVRFSRSVRGQEILDDVADGIRTNVSVGYMINDVKEEEGEGDLTTYRATSWQPHEISIVSCPADIKVGVGRGMDTTDKENKKMNEEVEVEEGTEVDPVQAALDGERLRQRDIDEVGQQYKQHGGLEFARIASLDPLGTAQDVKDSVLERMNEKSIEAPVVSRPAPRQPALSSTPMNLRYDKASLKPFERFGNRAEEAAYRSGQWSRAILFNDAKAERWCKDHGLRVMNEMGGSAGGFTVPDELEMAITDLRVDYGIARKLCKVIPMGSATASIPIRTAGVTAYFVNEQGAPSASDMTWGQAQLVAKNLSAETRITTQLAEDAIVDIAAIVADEHAWAFAAKEDACFINGDGTSTYGGITGLITKFEADATLAGYVVHPGSAADADTFSEVQADGLAKVMGALPSYARNGARWLGSPTSDEMIFSYLMASAGGNSTMTLGGAIVPQYLGKQREVSEVMPSGAATDYSAKVMLMYGDFAKSCFLGDRRGITIQVLRELYATSGQIAVLGTERFDLNVDYAVGDSSDAGAVVALIGN